MKKQWKSMEFWLAVMLIALVPVVVLLYYPSSSWALFLGNHLMYHWFTWAGASYLALSTPIFFYLKRRHKEKYQAIMKAHVFGNILALLLISFHFAYQSGSPFIRGTLTHLGLVLYTALMFLLVSGFLMRYHFTGKFWPASRYLHVSLVTTLYLVVFFHVLLVLNVI
jgi:hypothetical protein